ncbi:hypothetical protein K438DRAFT_2112069 [Mycena galopus ATCC 62051]|nr:hypothetical protein K438DRAFT_2112069 [Mycena galopus ATCC 62051]
MSDSESDETKAVSYIWFTRLSSSFPYLENIGKPKQLRVIVSVKSASMQERVLEAKSNGKEDQLSIAMESVLGRGCRLSIVVYVKHRVLPTEKVVEEEFSFNALRERCLGPNESGVYELSHTNGIIVSAKIELDQLEPEGAVKNVGAENVMVPQPVGSKSGVQTKDSVVSNLKAGLEIVQQVGKIVQSVPFIEPIGAILSTLVDVYKEVEDNNDKRDALVDKATALARDVSQAILRLKDLSHEDLINRLDPDLKEYQRLLTEVQNRVTETFNDRGKLVRVIKRGELGGELDSLGEKLSFWGTRFRSNRLVDIQIKQNIIAEDVHETHIAMLEDRLEKWLRVPDQKVKQSSSSGVRNRSPCRWFFEDGKLMTWQDNPRQLLWIEGASGTGKTIISSMIIEQLFKDRATLNSTDSTAIAYFYFELGQQSVESALRRLILQLSSQGPYQILNEQHQLCKGQTVPNYSELLLILEKLLLMFGRTYLVLDALDECKTEDYDRVAKFVATISAWSHIQLHVLITSQSRDVFENALLPLRNLSRIIPQKDTTSDDIRLYVSNELASRSDLQLWKSESGRITNYIVDKSAGMFRLAYCLLEQLKDCARLSELQATLDALPDNLHDIYARSLKSVPEKYLPDVQKLLQWLVFTERPLTLAELEDTIAFDFTNPERYTFDPDRRPKRGVFMKWLSGLVSITSSSRDAIDDSSEKEYVFDADGVFDNDGFYRSGSVVSLAHSSVQDYLQQRHPSWCSSCPIHVREETAHQLMAQSCICYLLHFDDHPLDAETFPDYPLALYAAKNWHYHLLRSSDQVALSTLTKDLLLPESRPYTALYRLNNSWDSPNWSPWSSIEPPLSLCAQVGYMAGVKFLCGIGADVNAMGNNGYALTTALEYASKNGHVEIAKFLLENGADVNRSSDDEFDPTYIYDYQQPPNALEHASRNGHLEIVRSLLDKGADVNADGREHTALQLASVHGYTEIVHLLIEKGANVHAQGSGGTALQQAAAMGHIEIVKLLLEKGAKINAWSGDFKLTQVGVFEINGGFGQGTALEEAAAHGHLEIVQFLLDQGADLNPQNTGFHGTPLQRAAEAGHIEIVKLMLNHGADVDAHSETNGTALQHASGAGCMEIVKVLLEEDADVNAQGGWHGTALQCASEHGDIEIVQLLLDKHANINAPSMGGTAWQRASRQSHTEIVHLLLENGADTGVDEIQWDIGRVDSPRPPSDATPNVIELQWPDNDSKDRFPSYLRTPSELTPSESDSGTRASEGSRF